jgi:hypothetical protein
MTAPLKAVLHSEGSSTAEPAALHSLTSLRSVWAAPENPLVG